MDDDFFFVTVGDQFGEQAIYKEMVELHRQTKQPIIQLAEVPLEEVSKYGVVKIVDDEIVDIALVVEKTKSGNYIGHTILPLNWAYNNARLVARPDSDWLVAEQIELDSDDDEE